MTGKPDVLQPMGPQRIRHDLVTEQEQVAKSMTGISVTVSVLNYKPGVPVHSFFKFSWMYVAFSSQAFNIPQSSFKRFIFVTRLENTIHFCMLAFIEKPK